eukprot:g1359.t1
MDTHIMVTFKISLGEANEDTIISQQRLVMFQSKTKDIAKYIVAKKEKGKVMGAIHVRDLVEQFGHIDTFEVVVLVGDPQYDDGVMWNLGNLKLKTGSISQEMVEPPLPLRLQQPQYQPEIMHIFVI